MRVMPPKGGPSRTGNLSHAFSAHGFMNKQVSSTDSLGPDYTDSKENNLRKSAQSVEKESLPNSKKVYVSGKRHVDLRVPFREISLAPTKTMSGELDVNEPVRVYDTSGPWGDPNVTLDPVQGLPPVRRDWILKRGDVETVAGRPVTAADDGWLSEKHAASRNGGSRLSVNGSQFQRKPLRAKSSAVTQLAYARRGVITPEMEFIAIGNKGKTPNAQRPTPNLGMI